MKFILTILSFFLLFPCYASDTVNVYPREGVLVFRGIDDTTTPLSVEDGRAEDAQNVKLSRSFKLAKRNGYSVINVGSRINDPGSGEEFPAVTGLFHAKLSDGTDYRIVVCGRNIYYDNSGVWTQINKDDTHLFTYDQNNQFVWTVGLDEIIFSNDTDPPKKWTGAGQIVTLDLTDLSASERPTKVKCLAWFKNYLILANTVENSVERPTRFRWSEVGTTEDWLDNDFLDISQLGGQEIEALGILHDNLYFFLTNSIWKATLVGGNDVFQLAKVVDGIGCIAKNSVQTVTLLNQRQGLVFLSQDKKVHFFDGVNIVEVSELISGIMDGLRADRLQYAVSTDTGEDYYLCVTTGSTATTNNLLLDYQYEIAEWTKHVQIDANAISQVVDSSSLRKTWFGNYDSFVYETDDTTTNSDVDGGTGDVFGVSTANLSDGSATGLQVVVTDVSHGLAATGAIVSITSGTGSGQEKVVVGWSDTGLIVESTFSTNPDSTSLYSVGAIEANYKTKWYDLGEPAQRKTLAKLYLWSDEQSGTDLVLEEFIDFGGLVTTETIDLTGPGGVWGTAIWGKSVWGGQTAIFKPVTLKGSGRFFQFNLSNNDVDEGFELYGNKIIYWLGDIQ